jgi:heme exporter protein C
MGYLKHWWKVLATVLVLYSLIIGMTIPLRNGIVSDKSSMTLKTGQEQTLTVLFYNARYKKEKPEAITARIRIDSAKAICAESVTITAERSLDLKFNIPTIDPNSIKAPFPFVEIGSPENGYVFSSVYLSVSTDTVTKNETPFCTASYLAPSTKPSFPFLNILEESIRNLLYHVPMWFGMMLLLLISVIYSVLQLTKPEGLKNDIAAKSFAGIGVLYGVLGIITGALWAKHTWGAYWSWDVKQNTSAVALLIYLAYFVLRSSFDDADKKARISAVYNIFAFATLIPLIYIIPRMVDSLHPGAEGNPAFSSYDLDNNLRLVFYPAVVGFILLGIWIATIWIRIEKIWQRKIETL